MPRMYVKWWDTCALANALYGPSGWVWAEDGAIEVKRRARPIGGGNIMR